MPEDTTEPNAQRPNIELPNVENYTFARLPAASANPELLGVLAQALRAQIQAGDYSAIDKIIELQAKLQETEQALRLQDLQTKQKALEQAHSIAEIRETRLTRETTARANTTRLLIGVMTFAFSVSLGYGVIHKDSNLADKVFTGSMALLGGGGIAIFSQKSTKDSEK